FGYEKGAFSGASVTGKKGLVELAANGTLFLDEVGDLSMESQAKLLRFLEEGEFYRVGGTRKHNVRTRVVSATNKDLGVLIEKGLFREDLYYRLAVVKVMVPSLNERPDDIVPMARYFLLEFNRKFGKSIAGISPEAEGALKAHRWRGNVRELKNIMERAALIGSGSELSLRELGLEGPSPGGGRQEPGDPMFPAIPPEGLDLASVQEALEKRYFEEALDRSGGNESRAAKLLNINHHTFRYRRRKLGL
ncbi:MAG TPA: sigma 54-interacting transcriptional regulator, partial [Candidatus Deferrimicrobiaceae bacterium]